MLAPAFVLVVVAAAGCARQPSPEPSGLRPAVADAAPVVDPTTVPLGLAEVEPSVRTTLGTETSKPPTILGDEAPEPKAPAPSLVARVIVPEISVFARPGGRHVASFASRGAYGEPSVFLVREARHRWLRVLLPIRPNEVEGWISVEDVRLSRHRYAVRVDLSERRLTALRGSTVILNRSVSVGLPQSPTPTGLFFTTVEARAPDPSGPYGPLALGLSGFSEVYTEFNGGEGQIAIHGTDAPHLIGQAVSAGCVRIQNDDVVRLAQQLPLGTPVRITR